MDGSSACGFFDLILGLFIEANIDGAGKVVGESFLNSIYLILRILQ